MHKQIKSAVSDIHFQRKEEVLAALKQDTGDCSQRIWRNALNTWIPVVLTAASFILLLGCSLFWLRIIAPQENLHIAEPFIYSHDAPHAFVKHGLIKGE